jgi:hypothetical protein
MWEIRERDDKDAAAAVPKTERRLCRYIYMYTTFASLDRIYPIYSLLRAVLYIFTRTKALLCIVKEREKVQYAAVREVRPKKK